jgi:adenylate cyclase class 2
MIETEVKVRASYEILKKLKEKFEFIGEEQHKDIYFNAPDRDFSRSDEALRLRKVNGKTILTYKGARKKSNLKSRYEIQLEVSNFENAKKLLEALGYKEVKRIEKKRRLFRRDNAIICFDNVVGLGSFIEVEILGEDLEEAEKRIKEILEELGLSNEELITNSYLELISELK